MKDPFAKDIQKAWLKNISNPYIVEGRYCSVCGAEVEVEPGGDENEPPYLYCNTCKMIVATAKEK